MLLPGPTDDERAAFAYFVKHTPEGAVGIDDGLALAMAARTLCKLSKCEHEIREHGMFGEGGGVTASTRLANRLRAELSALLGKIGMTPQDRLKLAVLVKRNELNGDAWADID